MALLTPDEILAIEGKVNHTFANKSLLIQAFTRSSFVNEQREMGYAPSQSNEVLELFGDTLLSLAVVELLFRRTARVTHDCGLVSSLDEGALSTVKHNLSNKRILAERIDVLGLSRYLILNHGDRETGVREEASVKEDLFESLVGAVYLDTNGDLAAVFETVRAMLDPSAYLDSGAAMKKPPKSALKEYCEKHRLSLSYPPDGVTVEGPDNSPLHTVTCCVEGYPPFRGTARRKQDAESAAAEAALTVLLSNAPTATPTENPRVRLKEWADRTHRRLTFKTEKVAEAPDRYRSTLSLDGEKIAVGEGYAKKEAERDAAAHACITLDLTAKGDQP